MMNPPADDAVSGALSMYVGEHCRICKREYRTLDDLSDAKAVFVGYADPDDGTRTACCACWRAASDGIHAEKTINLLVDALEKIEAHGCIDAARVHSWFCLEQRCSVVCAACIAHEALETFRGR